MEFKDSDGRLKRIEYRGKHLRASRTGGVSIRAQGKSAGINYTLNSKHGARVSTRIAKGTNVGFQNGRFILRGRYGTGATKLNISKTGFSVSTKTDIGTLNLLKPNYSSAKIGGVQVRGKNALIIQAIYAIFQLSSIIITTIFNLLLWVVKILFKVFSFLRIKIKNYLIIRKSLKLLELEKKWDEKIRQQPAEIIICALFYIILNLAPGKNNNPNSFINSISGFEDRETLAPLIKKITQSTFEQCVELISASLGKESNNLTHLELFFGALADSLTNKLESNTVLAVFWGLDYSIIKGGTRNHLQEKLLVVFAEACGIEPETN